MTQAVLVAGAGSWGTALALVLAGNGRHVTLWGHDRAHIEQLASTRENLRYLPGHRLPESINCIADPPGPEQGFEALVMAVPCHAVREVLTQLVEAGLSLPPVCLVCKGLEPGTQLPCHEIVTDVLGETHPVSILSGPSFAGEVAAGLPTAVTVASARDDVAAAHAGLFHNESFRIYTNDDIAGVALAGAIKNVLAIAAGVADGLGFGANTRAALITRGLAEIMRLGVAMGGRQETFMGLSGLGDLVLTCTDDQSRNRRLGLALAAGLGLDEASRQIGQAIEGAKTVREVCVLADRYAIDMPISTEVLKVIDQECSPREAVSNLLSRDPKPE